MVMHTSPLSAELHRYNLLRERLAAAFPDLDEETARDTLEGMSTLNELIAAIVRSALLDEALQAGLKSRMVDLRSRLTRFEERSSKKRRLVLEAMSDAGLAKLEQPDFTVSVRAGSPALLVVTEEIIPLQYWMPQPPKLDRQAILNDLKVGEEIPGVQLGNREPVLTVRTK
jgi:hypothetical protein